MDARVFPGYVAEVRVDMDILDSELLIRVCFRGAKNIVMKGKSCKFPTVSVNTEAELKTKSRENITRDIADETRSPVGL